MRRIGLVLAVAGMAAAGACTGLSTTTGTSVPANTKVAPADSDFDLTVGQSARVDALTISFNGVTADSRCPLGVMCIQAGNATVSLTVTDGAGTKTPLMLYANPTPQTPDSMKVAGYQVTLVALQPIQRRAVTIAPASYVATLHATRNKS